MKSVEELKGKVPNELLESMAGRGIKSLTPPQELAVEAGLLSGSNTVVASPTASGKTLIAEMAMIRSVIGKQKKAIYVAPMRALVSEKYEEFKQAYPYLKIAMSIGELDSLDPWLSKYDIIFVSTEKFDSLIRHGLDWLGSIGCIVFDEVHMIGEQGRGPTLEILITKLKRLCKDTQILALSATIGNADEVARWLEAKLVESEYRPVKLEKGIVLQDRVYYREGDEALQGSSMLPEIRIVQDVLTSGKQIIVFYSTKRNAEAGAEKFQTVIKEYLKQEDRERLDKVSERVLAALSKPTAQCEKLAKVIKNGAAFHHSGLVNAQRHEVENSFKQNLIKVICSTTTLGLGVNLPAQTVLVRDTSRYGEDSGMTRISANEVTQLFGRAGRPKYDTTGRALLIAKSKAEIVDLYQKYIDAELEPIDSSLGILPVLRTHVLAFIATNFLRSEQSITNFFGETFYGYQYSNMQEINKNIERILEELRRWGFVEKKGSIYNATKLGARVSELYIDPLSAKRMVDMLMKVERDDIANLFMICNTLEMRPYVRVTEEAEEKFVLYNQLINYEEEERQEEEMFEYYYPEKPFSTALMLHKWANETSEPELMKEYGTTPGALFVKISNADWLLYAAMELGKIMKVSTTKLLEMRVRIRYGIAKELVDLVSLEQVGRVRARMMYDSGIKRVSDLRGPDVNVKLVGLFGPEIAKKIMDQIDTS